MAASDPLSTSGTFLSTGRLQDLFRDAPSLSDSVKFSFASPIATEGHKSASFGAPRVLPDLHDIFYKSSEEFQAPKICFGLQVVPFSLTEISFAVPYIDGYRGGDEETPLS